MRIVYDNLIDDLAASALTALTEDDYFPVTNVQDQRLSFPYRSTAATAQTIVVDLGATTGTTVVALMGHNLTASAAVTVSGAPDGSTFSSVTSIAYNSGVMLTFYATSAARWWKFAIDDPTNPDGYLELGRVWVGNYATIDPSSLLGFTVVKRRSDNVYHGRSRQKFASEGVSWRAFSMDFPVSDNSVVETVLAVWDSVGLHSSFIFCNFDTLRGYSLVEPCYVSLTEEPAFKHDTNMRWSYSLAMEEER